MPSHSREDTPLQRLGATIRHYRRQRKLSQKALAALSGCDTSYLSGIEQGKRNVSALLLLRIAQSLQIPVSHLMAPLDEFSSARGTQEQDVSENN